MLGKKKENDLRSMSKTELLTMLRDQEAEINELKEENARLEQQLEDKRIGLQECGSIAEAALKLNGVFEAAQAAAEQYLESVKAGSSERGDLDAQMQEELARTRARCRQMEEEAAQRVERQRQAFARMVERCCLDNPELKEKLEAQGLKILHTKKQA